MNQMNHGLWTLNEGIHQRNLENRIAMIDMPNSKLLPIYKKYKTYVVQNYFVCCGYFSHGWLGQ